MPLTELQLPTKENFYRNIQHSASEMDNLITRWRNLAEFVGRIDASDFDAMGVPVGTGPGMVRTDLTNFRILLNEVVDLYDGNSVVPTNLPSEIIDRIRTM